MDSSTYFFRTVNELVVGDSAIEDLPNRIKKFEPVNALLITDPGVADAGLIEPVERVLENEGIAITTYSNAPSEPTVQEVEDCFNEVSSKQHDIIIGIGGGSSMDLAKIIAIMFDNEEPVREFVGTDKITNSGLPTVMIPTTAGTGSEVTPNAIVTLEEQEVKKGIVSSHLLAEIAVLDPSMTQSLPPPLVASTGIDALTHSVESFISVNSNELSDMFALKSIELIINNIQSAFHDQGGAKVRKNMLLGASLGGMALTIAGTTAVHALAYPLGGKFDVPHGTANSMLLPYVLDYNFDSIVDKLDRIADVIEGIPSDDVKEDRAKEVISRVKSLINDLDIPQSLQEFGVTQKDLDGLAEEASEVKRLLDNNPKEIDEKGIKEIYKNAFGPNSK